MTTPTPPADAPTPRTEEHIEGYGHKVARFMPAFGEPAHDVYVKADFARQLERELAGTLHSLDAMSKAHADKVEELAAKDARIAALEKERDELLEGIKELFAITDGIKHGFDKLCESEREGAK